MDRCMSKQTGSYREISQNDGDGRRPWIDRCRRCAGWRCQMGLL